MQISNNKHHCSIQSFSGLPKLINIHRCINNNQMQEESFQVQSIFDTPFDNTPHLIPDEFLMKLSNLQTQTVDQLPNLIQKVLSDKEPNDVELQQLSDVDLAILMKVKDKSHCSAKRPDELQKMFFKRAVKYAENLFFRKKKSKRVNSFYKHYFEEVAEKMGCSILNFYHPNKYLSTQDRQIKSGSKTGQKSFNATYIKLIVSSRQFRQVCKEYMGKFMKDSFKERMTKIKKLIQTCRKISSSPVISPKIQIQKNIFQMKDEDYQKELNTQKEQINDLVPPTQFYFAKITCIERLETYFKSSKCKIPWNDKDIQLAYKCAEETLGSFSVNGD